MRLACIKELDYLVSFTIDMQSTRTMIVLSSWQSAVRCFGDGASWHFADLDAGREIIYTKTTTLIWLYDIIGYVKHLRQLGLLPGRLAEFSGVFDPFLAVFVIQKGGCHFLRQLQGYRYRGRVWEAVLSALGHTHVPCGRKRRLAG